ncbi:MAG: hypothetical protein EU539_10965 [Promethearchaeota archaeon]|nr:MAG: hypothetical protein EU539_10965 [Candidatus Lokiarchaeota archaeon]
MNIHSLFILKTSGVCMYHRHFTDEFKNIDINLITPFISAIFSFSENVVNRKIEELEMADLRLTFKTEMDIIFVLIADLSVSTLFTSTRLISIADAFFGEYYQLDKLREYMQINNPKFDELIDSIIKGEEDLFKTKQFYSKIIDLFKSKILENEIVGAAILSSKGNIIYSSLPSDILLNSIKELEIRFASGAKTIPELFYSLETGEKVFSSMIMAELGSYELFIVLLFEREIPLGMCEVNLFKTVKEIKKLISEESS